MNPVEPDEHLRAALRHAPDAELSAPPQLGARIIAEARRSAAQPPADRPSHGAVPLPARLHRWLAGWRLQHWGASGALATVLMAGFIALLWRGEVPAPASDAPPAAAPARMPVAKVAEPAREVAGMTNHRSAGAPAVAQDFAADRATQSAPQAAPEPPAALALPPWREPPGAGDVLGWRPAAGLIAPDAAWLARLARLTQGRWQPVHRATAKLVPSAELPLLQWQRADRTLGFLWFGASDVTWCGAAAACEQAPLSDAERRQLLAPVAR